MKRRSALAMACLVLCTLPGEAAAQEVEKPPVLKKCPPPNRQQVITMTAPPPTTATPLMTDFPTSSCSAGFEPNFLGTVSNRCFRHTFTWKAPQRECRCFSGQLTIKYSAIEGGANWADNDTIAFYSGGSHVTGTSLSLYSGGATTGQVLTKTIPVSCELLSRQRLSFLIQDDTQVISATLRVVHCCAPCPDGKVETTFPGTEIKYCCDRKPGAPSFCCTAQKLPGAGQ